MKQNYKEEEKIYLNPVGLANLSRYQRINNYKSFKKASLFNSCYMNASIQCLFRIDGFVKKIIQANEGSLVLATKKLIYDMQKPNNNYNQCSVLDIKKAMGEKNEKYNDKFQEDANEFITNYLNYLIEETRDFANKIDWICKKGDEEFFNKFYRKFFKRNGTSFIIDLFYGVIRTEYYCKKCKGIFNIKFSSFNILEIPVIEQYSFENNEPLNVQNLIENFISEKDDMDEICSKCRTTVKMKTSINSLPKCLIIYFNKEEYQKTNNIDIPKTIDMKNYVYDKSLIKDNDCYYNLKGIIFYSNYTSKVGHYKAACLVNNTDNEKWYYFDDNNVKTDKNLLRIYDDENPYLLFYEK